MEIFNIQVTTGLVEIMQYTNYKWSNFSGYIQYTCYNWFSGDIQYTCYNWFSGDIQYTSYNWFSGDMQYTCYNWFSGGIQYTGYNLFIGDIQYVTTGLVEICNIHVKLVSQHMAIYMLQLV